MVRKELADHETTNELHSTIGNANSFHGIQRSSRMLLIGCALFCQILNCHFAGVPLCRYGSRSAVAVSVSWDNGALAAVVVAGSVRLSPLAFSGSSTLSEWISRRWMFLWRSVEPVPWDAPDAISSRGRGRRARSGWQRGAQRSTTRNCASRNAQLWALR